MVWRNGGWGGTKICPACNGSGLLDSIHVCPTCNGTKIVRNKFNNVKTIYNGIRYDSKREAEKAMELDMLKNGGEVLEWTPHPRYLLIPRYLNSEGKIVRPCYYIPDFWVKYASGAEAVIDIKGFETPEFKLKKKMFNYRYKDKNIELVIEK